MWKRAKNMNLNRKEKISAKMVAAVIFFIIKIASMVYWRYALKFKNFSVTKFVNENDRLYQ